MEGVIHMCVESGKQQPEASASLGVKTSVCTQATIIKDKETNGDATCTCRYMQATICGSEPLHMDVLIRVQTLVLWHTCPQATTFLIPFSQYRSRIAFIFIGENIHRPDVSMYL